MILVARPIDVWPGELRSENQRQSPQFTASWSDTTDLLAREVKHLTPRGKSAEVVLQMAVAERDLRLDGWIRADARPDHPGVIISFESKHGPLRYSTDLFTGRSWKALPGWQANVRAIALGLEALRRVDRYGISRGGEQYRGWNALPPGVPMPAAQMTVEEAARFILEQSGDGAFDFHELLDDDVLVADLYRTAAKRLHPDHGGDPEMFKRLTEARDLLRATS